VKRAIGLAGLLLAGCPTVPTAVEYACQSDADCAPGTSCVAGYCGGAAAATTGTTGSAAGSSSGGASSGGTTTGAAATGGGTTGASTGGSSTGGSSTGAAATPERILAGAQIGPEGDADEVWDVSPGADAGVVVSSGLLPSDDAPAAIAIGADGELLVQLAQGPIYVFDQKDGFVGRIEVPWEAGDPQEGAGLAYLRQDGGPAIVVASDPANGVTAFKYAGRAEFDGGDDIAPSPLWPSNPANGQEVQQCFPGPQDTVLVPTYGASGWYLAWYDAQKGVPYGDGAFFTPSKLGLISGGVTNPATGDVLVVGSPPDVAGGAAELLDPSGNCLYAVTAGECKNTDCASSGVCTGGSSLLSAELGQAVWIPSLQEYVATFRAAPASQGNLVALSAQDLTPSATLYFTAPSGIALESLAGF
jgi:hypothetical protein